MRHMLLSGGAEPIFLTPLNGWYREQSYGRWYDKYSFWGTYFFFIEDAGDDIVNLYIVVYGSNSSYLSSWSQTSYKTSEKIVINRSTLTNDTFSYSKMYYWAIRFDIRINFTSGEVYTNGYWEYNGWQNSTVVFNFKTDALYSSHPLSTQQTYISGLGYTGSLV